MFRFVSRAENSHHYFEACEVLAELLVNRGSYDRAEPYFEKLAAAPWPETQWRAALLEGRMLLAQAKYGDALAKFDVVLNASGASAPADESEKLTLAATVGKADCLAESGKGADAIRMIEDVIAKADPEQAEAQALAYNALGRCYLKSDKPKDALLAFLHVDVLYQSVPEAHAEALSRLAPLWESMGKADRARDARKVLSDRYPQSRWAR
jgi:tetratricopeptide (TPR) repeat protein